MLTSTFIIILLFGKLAGQNIALGKETRQISVHIHRLRSVRPHEEHLESKFAVDGDIGQHHNSGNTTCAHTQCNHSTHWWSVDFGRTYYIDRVIIYGRTDCCQKRLADFDILVYNPPLASWTAYDTSRGQLCYRQNGVSPTILNVTCNTETSVKGRYLKIVKKRNWKYEDYCDALALCEVQVIGHDAGNTSTEPMCPCSCSYKQNRDYWRHRHIPNHTIEEWRRILAPLLEKLDKELRINKTALSIHRRRKTSANDKRKSAQRLGVMGVVFLSSVIALVVYIDVVAIWKGLKTIRRLHPETV